MLFYIVTIVTEPPTPKTNVVVSTEKSPEDIVIRSLAAELLINNIVTDLDTVLKSLTTLVQAPHWSKLLIIPSVWLRLQGCSPGARWWHLQTNQCTSNDWIFHWVLAAMNERYCRIQDDAQPISIQPYVSTTSWFQDSNTTRFEDSSMARLASQKPHILISTFQYTETTTDTTGILKWGHYEWMVLLFGSII